MRDVGRVTLEVALKVIAAVILAVIVGGLFFGAFRDGDWYNLPFAWASVAAGVLVASTFVDRVNK